MCKECVIGIWSEYTTRELVTYKQLEQKVKEYNEHCDVLNHYFNTNEYKKHDITYFLDGRTNTQLLRFNNCCWCGNKINWKELKHNA